jgi:2,4-didehydro-3-deoxy-L-rhamnonate hydrolase
MKICRFNDSRIGLVRDTTVHDVTRLVPETGREPVLAAKEELASVSERDLARMPTQPLDSVALLAPIRMPRKILAAPDNYQVHAAEMHDDPAVSFGRTVMPLDQAGLFLKAPSSLTGPSGGIVRRFPKRRTDYEVELVAIVGKDASNVEPEHALDVLAGYAIGLDVTMRGPEDRSFRKSIDSYTVVGPWMTSAETIPDPRALLMSLRLNGELRQRTILSDMIVHVRNLVAYASKFGTLNPGDMIFTGTPAGVGPIKGGDVILAEISDIGKMEVTVREYEAR